MHGTQPQIEHALFMIPLQKVASYLKGTFANLFLDVFEEEWQAMLQAQEQYRPTFTHPANHYPNHTQSTDNTDSNDTAQPDTSSHMNYHVDENVSEEEENNVFAISTVPLSPYLKRMLHDSINMLPIADNAIRFSCFLFSCCPNVLVPVSEGEIVGREQLVNSECLTCHILYIMDFDVPAG